MTRREAAQEAQLRLLLAINKYVCTQERPGYDCLPEPLQKPFVEAMMKFLDTGKGAQAQCGDDQSYTNTLQEDSVNITTIYTLRREAEELKDRMQEISRQAWEADNSGDRYALGFEEEDLAPLRKRLAEVREELARYLT